MEEKYIRTIQERKGTYLHFKQDEVLLPGGRKTTRDVVLHPGAVAIAACTADKKLIMVRQYRYAAGEIMYELPAGKLEKGEDPLFTAQRELEEETGWKAKRWEKLTSFYTAPGYANEVIHLFLAEDLEYTETKPDPDEIIEYEKISLSEAQNKVRNGEIKDAKTIIGLLWISMRE